MAAAPFFSMTDCTKEHALHAITHLRSYGSLKLTKQYRRDKNGSIVKKSYDNAKHFNAFSKPIRNIKELSDFLKFLENTPNACIIRGKLKEEHKPIKVRRSLEYFEDEPCPWICIDIDSVLTPDHTDPLTEAEMLIEHVIGLLPSEFHDASCHYQFSSSFGMEGITGEGSPGETIKVHLWFMLNRPCTSAELRRWAKIVNEKANFRLIDESLYNPVQIHYTAKPIFENVPDPVRFRSGLLERLDDVVAIEIPTPENVTAKPMQVGLGLSGDNTATGFENYLARIGDPHGFNIPIYKAIWSYLATCRNKGVNGDPEELKQRLKERIAVAENRTRPQSDIDWYMSDARLDDQIRRAHAKFMKQMEAQASQTMSPTYPNKEKPLAEARNGVMNFVDEFMWMTFPAWIEAQEQYARLYEKWREAKKEADEKGLMFLAPEPMPPSHPIDVLAPDVGTGKTYAAIAYAARYIIWKKYILRETMKPVVMLVPTIELAEELKHEAIRQGIKNVGIMRGRMRDNPDGTSKKMCKDPKRIKSVESFAGSARDYACGTGARGYSCPHYSECAYQKQRKTLQRDDLIIMAHSNYYITPAIKDLDPSYVIIDEDITKSAIPDENIQNPTQDERDVLFDFLLEQRSVPDGRNRDGKKETEFLMSVSRRLHQALANCPDGGLSREELEKNKITARDCRKAAFLESIRIEEPDDIFPKLNTKTLVSRAKKAKNMRPYYILASMWELLAVFLDSPEQKSCVTVRTIPVGDKKILRVLKKRSTHETYRLPTLLLDATFSPEAYRTIFGDYNRYLSIEAEKPYQYVRQIIDTDVTVSSFKEADKNGKIKPAPIAYNVFSHIQKKSRLYAGKGEGKHDVLVVLPSKIEAFFLDQELFPALPDNVDLAHYNNVRGKNIYEGVACVIIVSRLQPPVYPIEEKAEAAKQSAIQRIKPDKLGRLFYPTRNLALRLADGSGQPVPRQRYHFDPMANALLQGAMVAEIIQAVGRGRGVNRTEDNPLAVDIITNIAMPITVKETMTLHEFLSNKYDYMIMNGAMLCSPADQAIAYPGLFETSKAASKYWENMRKNTPHTTIEEYTIAKWGELISRGANAPITHKVQYRSHDKARGRAKTFLYNTQIIPSPLEWLKAYVSSDAVLVSGPEKLPWEASNLSWSEKLALPSQLKRETSHLLPMPDLDKIKRKPRTKEKEPTFALEDIRHAFGKSKAEIQALLKKHKNDEQAVIVQLLCDIVPIEGRAAYGRLPEIVQEKLDHTLLDRLSA